MRDVKLRFAQLEETLSGQKKAELNDIKLIIVVWQKAYEAHVLNRDHIAIHINKYYQGDLS